MKLSFKTATAYIDTSAPFAPLVEEKSGHAEHWHTNWFYVELLPRVQVEFVFLKKRIKDIKIKDLIS